MLAIGSSKKSSLQHSSGLRLSVANKRKSPSRPRCGLGAGGRNDPPLLSCKDCSIHGHLGKRSLQAELAAYGQSSAANCTKGGWARYRGCAVFRRCSVLCSAGYLKPPY